jgi:hypothetical protein
MKEKSILQVKLQGDPRLIDEAAHILSGKFTLLTDTGSLANDRDGGRHRYITLMENSNP